AARRVRHVDAASGNECRAPEGKMHEPARRDRQEKRCHRPAQDGPRGKTAALFALEAKERALNEQLTSFVPKLESTTRLYDDAQGAIATKEAELAQLAARHHETAVSSESQ